MLNNHSNFWRALKKSFTNFEINLIVTWSADCFLVAGTLENQVSTVPITDTKLYVAVTTLST